MRQVVGVGAVIAGVSIRTRHCCRVMRRLEVPDPPAFQVSIRTRHCCRVMHRIRRHRRLVQRFNPHPALLPGDARAADVQR